jgi:hypothetical protein
MVSVGTRRAVQNNEKLASITRHGRCIYPSGFCFLGFHAYETETIFEKF